MTGFELRLSEARRAHRRLPLGSAVLFATAAVFCLALTFGVPPF